ncbi:hypothetical protein DERF_012597 [Dermatophagoides farinae]|uniref:Uncharacterized protein n=1 Tax=Dermatophagoides farinae TaxID=6954 RepID=A0A922KYL8_DERFA|nr:hypothetical protein DERF_012597 [Dermatophagoides farinae]
MFRDHFSMLFLRAAAAARSPSVSNGASPLLSNDCFNLSTILALPLIRNRPSCNKPPEFSIYVQNVLEDISGVKFESVWVPMAVVVLMFNVSDVGLNAVSTDADIRLILAFISLSEMIFKMLKY